MTAKTKNQDTHKDNGSIGTTGFGTGLRESKVGLPVSNGASGAAQPGTPRENRNKPVR